MLVCPCHGPGEPQSFAALDLGAGPAPELAYVTAKFAALAPFGKVAALLSELLPISGAQNAGTVRNRTLRVGQGSCRSAPSGLRGRPQRQRTAPSWLGLMAASTTAGVDEFWFCGSSVIVWRAAGVVVASPTKRGCDRDRAALPRRDAR